MIADRAGERLCCEALDRLDGERELDFVDELAALLPLQVIAELTGILQRDVELIQRLAERTRHIRLGTGVVSLPYHHPLLVADRLVLLDHLTRGRAMLGVGAGLISVAATEAQGFDAVGYHWPIAQIERLIEQSGGFGSYLFMDADWASPAATLRSNELFAREVMPHFKKQSQAPLDANRWTEGASDRWTKQTGDAIGAAMEAYEANKSSGGGRT